jgi:hypothetical protein
VDAHTVACYVNELAQNEHLIQPKQVDVVVDASGDEDHLLTALNAELLAVRDGSPCAGLLPDFRRNDLSDQLLTGVKVYGDPWKIHSVIAVARALSTRSPLIPFGVQCEDGPCFTLLNGVSSSPDLANLETWVSAFPRPRLERLFSRVVLRVAGSTEAVAQVAGSIRELEEFLPGELLVTLEEARNSLAVFAEPGTGGTWSHFPELLWRCRHLWFYPPAPESPIEAEHTTVGVAISNFGARSWNMQVDDLTVFLALVTVVRSGLGS